MPKAAYRLPPRQNSFIRSCEGEVNKMKLAATDVKREVEMCEP